MKATNADAPGQRGFDVPKGRVDSQAGSGRYNFEDTAGNEATGHTAIIDGATVSQLEDGFVSILLSGSGGGGGSTLPPLVVPDSGSSVDVDLSAYEIIDITLTDDVALTVLPPAVQVASWLWVLRQDGVGGHVVSSWPTGWQWQDADGTSGGSAPTLFTAAGAQDVIEVWTLDGGATYGAASRRGDHRLLLGLTSGDPHTQYVLEASADWIDLTDAGETALHSHAGAAGSRILLADGHPTPFTFDDLLQMDDGSDFMYADV